MACRQKTLVATERRRARVRKQGDDWFAHRLPAVSAQPDHLVFIDETSVKTNLTRQRVAGRSEESGSLWMPLSGHGEHRPSSPV